ncbi:MAG: type II toxin-antitoxin system VapC family toxin [Desulfurococcales archaeon]|nr:type II toxin-antitoxin system VapC family toxin [Desulfurococcales archaeon]
MVLDASFLVKLVLEEEGSESARALAKSWAIKGEVLGVPDLALPEALNAIWKHTSKIKDIGVEEALNSVKDLLRLWATMKVYSSKDLALEAFKLALKEDITVYDALYIHLARSTGSGLATFDEKLSNVAEKYGITTYP